MRSLAIEIRPRLQKLLPLLASDQAGEVLAAADAICKTLRGSGNDLHDLAAAIVIKIEPKEQASGGAGRRTDGYSMWPAQWSFGTRIWVMDGLRTGADDGVFNEWERTFARDIADRIDDDNCRFTEKQVARINALLTKLRRGGRTPS